MNATEFRIFSILVLGLNSTHDGMGTESKGHKQRDRSYVHMLLTALAMITNLHPVIQNEIANDR